MPNLRVFCIVFILIEVMDWLWCSWWLDRRVQDIKLPSVALRLCSKTIQTQKTRDQSRSLISQMHIFVCLCCNLEHFHMHILLCSTSCTNKGRSMRRCENAKRPGSARHYITADGYTSLPGSPNILLQKWLLANLI